MTIKENYLAAVDGKEHPYVPDMGQAVQMVGMGPISILEYPFMTGGPDIFGVPWVIEPEGGVVEPGYQLFDDVTKWRDYVKFPDLDSIDFEGMAAQEMAAVNRDEKVTTVFLVYGVFLRLIYFMGFADGLMALIEEPEACMDFFEAMSDYHIDEINHFIDAYHPDMFTYGEDMATASSLFMSPQTYRSLIKPYHKKIMDAIAARGVRPVMHTCGYCTDVLDDYVEIGVKLWNSAQPSNDLAALLKKYEGKMAIEGGWDSQGPVSFLGASTDDLLKEMDRCMNEYGKYSNFIMMITLMNEKGNSVIFGDDRLPALYEEFDKMNKKIRG